MVLPIRDKTLPSVFAAVDVVLRRLGGAPTYVLTDNEKTVTVEHVARLAVRNPQTVAFARHYGLVVDTCEPADPASKGGSESTVKLAKGRPGAHECEPARGLRLVRRAGAGLRGLLRAGQSPGPPGTRRAPADMLAEERARLRPLPAEAHTVTFGITRVVPPTTPMVSFEGGQYSVPHRLLGETVWVRVHGQGPDEQVVIVHAGPDGAREVTRHRRATPGGPRLDDAHFPPAPPASAVERAPRPRMLAEAAFLALGPGARLWLTEAAAAGTTRMRIKTAEAVSLAKLTNPQQVDRALGDAAVNGRFGETDLAAILAHASTARPGPAHAAGEQRSLAQGTRGWTALGTASPPEPAR